MREYLLQMKKALRFFRNFPPAHVGKYLAASAIFCLLACILLSACGRNNMRPTDASLPSGSGNAEENCPGVFLFGPSRYVISLVAGEPVMLDPAKYPVPVYCTAAQAREAAKAALESGRAPASMDLQIYILEGEWRETAVKSGDRYLLRRPAVIVDFVD